VSSMGPDSTISRELAAKVMSDNNRRDLSWVTIIV
jgi:hypothetical protein